MPAALLVLSALNDASVTSITNSFQNMYGASGVGNVLQLALGVDLA